MAAPFGKLEMASPNVGAAESYDLFRELPSRRRDVANKADVEWSVEHLNIRGCGETVLVPKRNRFDGGDLYQRTIWFEYHQHIAAVCRDAVGLIRSLDYNNASVASGDSVLVVCHDHRDTFSHRDTG